MPDRETDRRIDQWLQNLLIRNNEAQQAAPQQTQELRQERGQERRFEQDEGRRAERALTL